ncbi:hypothetical protein J6590_103858 [Homalodisca vitripennis]|nr:hypothetical protein J6590_103858 [Homalodisca vitripennis]
MPDKLVDCSSVSSSDIMTVEIGIQTQLGDRPIRRLTLLDCFALLVIVLCQSPFRPKSADAHGSLACAGYCER